MQRSGAATRRFYAAFYQWTVRSANPTRRCAGDSLVLRRKQGAAHATHSKTGVRSYSSTSTPNKASEFHGTEEQLRSEEVQSIAKRPYRDLAAWDHVVRAKAKRSVTLEIAVPGKVLRDKDIKKKAEVFEVQLTVSNFKEGLDNDVLCPVHLKGDYSDVWAIWRRLYQIGHTNELRSTTTQSANQTDVEPTAHKVQQPIIDGPTGGPDGGQIEEAISLHGPDDGQVEKVISLPEAFVKPIGKRGTIEYFQSKFGVQAGRLDKYGMYNFMQLKGDTKQVKEVLQFVEELRTYVSRQRRPSVGGSQLAKRPQIISPNDLRSEDLNYWQSVRRKQLSGRAEEEFCLPELAWQRMRQDGDVKDLGLFFGIIIKELEVFDNAKKRCIGLNGIVADVDRAKNWLAEFRVTIPEMQVDEEYLRLHAGVTGQEMSGGDVATTVQDDEAAPESSQAESTVDQELDSPGKEPLEIGSPTPEPNSQPSSHTVSDIEVRRYKAPKYLILSEDQDPLAEIQFKANLKALRIREASSGRYLQAIGTTRALGLAQDLIQDGIERYNQQHGTTYASLRNLELKKDFARLQPKHFAVLKISKKDSKTVNDARAILSSECDIKASQLRRMNEEFDAMEVVGHEQGIRLAIAELQSILDQTQYQAGNPHVELEVLHAGTVKASEFGDVDRVEKAALQDLYKAALPHAELPRSYYAWVAIPYDRSLLSKLHALSERRPYVSLDWENQVSFKEFVAIKMEGYRLAILDAVESFSRLLYYHSARHKINNAQAKILSIDLIEFVDDGRDFIRNLPSVSWKRMLDFPETSLKESAEAPKQRAQSSGEEARMFYTLPIDDRASEVKASSNSEESIAAKTVWKPEHVSATEPYKETAHGIKEHAQSGDEKPKISAGQLNSTPSSRNDPGVKAHGNGGESVAKAVVDQSSEQGEPRLTRNMRTALRHLSQPVAVITSAQQDPSLKVKRRWTLARGVTVSSFCTVTLTPVPVISFNLRVPSRSWDAIATSGLLRVHLLKASPEGAAVAHAFTQRYTEPHEPFGLLSNHPGAEVKHGNTPLISWPAAIQTSMAAMVLPEKCIQVGDHMIVMAEVRKVNLSQEPDFVHEGALSYGMQGYRHLGGEIKPMQIEASKTKQAGEKVQAVASAKSSEKEAPEISTKALNKKLSSKTLEDIGPSSPILDQETLQQVLEETETSYATQSLPSQAAAANRMLAEALKAVQDAYRVTSEPAAPSSQAQSPAADQQSKATANEGRSAGKPTFGKGWGFSGSNASQSRTMSTWTRSPYRSYSSRASGPAYPPVPKKILKTTVGDYLCQLPAHSKRYAGLVNMQRNTERIEAALEQNGKLSPEEVAELEDEVQISRRKISRELAVRNAQDLCAMLDDGRVVMTRVPFLESNLEQGQAALLAEAKLLRDSLERGGLGAADFEKAKAALMKDYEYIDEQLMRLRDMVEEDDIDDDEDR